MFNSRSRIMFWVYPSNTSSKVLSCVCFRRGQRRRSCIGSTKVYSNWSNKKPSSQRKASTLAWRFLITKTCIFNSGNIIGHVQVERTMR